jgi:hypothetical protein
VLHSYLRSGRQVASAETVPRIPDNGRSVDHRCSRRRCIACRHVWRGQWRLRHRCICRQRHWRVSAAVDSSRPLTAVLRVPQSWQASTGGLVTHIAVAAPIACCTDTVVAALSLSPVWSTMVQSPEQSTGHLTGTAVATASSAVACAAVSVGIAVEMSLSAAALENAACICRGWWRW